MFISGIIWKFVTPTFGSINENKLRYVAEKENLLKQTKVYKRGKGKSIFWEQKME